MLKLYFFLTWLIFFKNLLFLLCSTKLLEIKFKYYNISLQTITFITAIIISYSTYSVAISTMLSLLSSFANLLPSNALLIRDLVVIGLRVWRMSHMNSLFSNCPSFKSMSSFILGQIATILSYFNIGTSTFFWLSFRIPSIS